MSKIAWRQVLPLALAAFFVVGSLTNIIAPGSIYDEYLRWGYPRWFHFVTGSLELTSAILLFRAPSRLLGSALGCTVMFAALATVVIHGEYGHTPCRHSSRRPCHLRSAGQAGASGWRYQTLVSTSGKSSDCRSRCSTRPESGAHRAFVCGAWLASMAAMRVRSFLAGS